MLILFVCLFVYAVLGVDSRAMHMLDESSTSELHPQHVGKQINHGPSVLAQLPWHAVSTSHIFPRYIFT
jgi:hypothetical protein